MSQDVFEKFRYSFFEDAYSWHDGLDIEAAKALSGHDRNKAEDMLLAFLPDTRAVIGLGAIRSQRGKPILQAMFAEIEPHDFSSGNVEIAKALCAIEPNPDCVAYLSATLRQLFGWTTRMDAAIALGGVADPVAVDALKFSLDDRDDLVRHHAASSLLALHGVAVDKDNIENCTVRIMSKDKDRRASGKAEALAACAGRKLI